MLSRLVISAPLLLLALVAPQTQNSRPSGAAPPPVPNITAAPPIKMGLWEATVSSSTGQSVMKTRACVTPESYQEQVSRVPPGCTVSNRVVTNSSLTADVSCTMANGVSGTGHVQANFASTDQVHTTIQVSMAMNGRTMPLTFTSDSHFVQADCGDIAPGTTRDVE